MKVAVTLLTAVASAAVGAEASPPAAFGIMRGQSVSALQVVTKLNDRIYEVIPPVPNSNLVRYTVSATKSTGVCQVWADSPKRYKQAVANEDYSRLKRALIYKFGSAKIMIPAGEIYYEYGLDYGDAWWERRLPQGISSINLSLAAAADGTSLKYASVLYTFSNFSACRAAGIDKSGL